MRVTKGNTETIVRNMRAEGQTSRADYLELMQAKIDELWQMFLIKCDANDKMWEDRMNRTLRIAELEEQLISARAEIHSLLAEKE